MLGLGSSAAKQQKPPSKILLDAKPPNPLPADYFREYNVEGGRMGRSANQTIGGQTGWLKLTYPNANQTDISGVVKTNIIGKPAVQPQYYWKCTFKIYLETLTDWTNDDINNTEVTLKINFGNRLYQVDIAADSVVSIDTGVQKVAAKEQDGLFIYFDVGTDLPEANASFYIKDLKLKVGRTQDSFS